MPTLNYQHFTEQLDAMLRDVQTLTDMQEKAFWFHLWGQQSTMLIMDDAITKQDYLRAITQSLKFAKGF